MDPVNVMVQHAVEPQRLTDLLTCALEGGSNYWYLLDTDKSDKAGQRYWSDAPEHGGSLRFTTNDRDYVNGQCEWTLTWRSMVNGLQVMATKYPHHMAAVLDENEDADTGDVFLQCALFGEVVFG